jgi:hypothetical protein
MASWCLITHLSPDVYRSCSRLEREAFIRQAKRMKLVK